MKKLFFLLVIGLFTACTSNNDSVQQQDADLKIHKVFINEMLATEYSYTSEGELLEVKDYHNEEITVSSYNYIEDTTVINRYNAEGVLMHVQKYFRTNPITIRSERWSNNNILLNHSLYNFHENNSCGWTEVEMYNLLGEVYFQSIRTFTDENCSYNIEYYSVENEFDGGKYVKLDGKNFALSAALNKPFPFPMPGNIIKLSDFSSNNSVNENSSYNAVFQYNSSNYPVSETRTYLSGSQMIYTYEYY